LGGSNQAALVTVATAEDGGETRRLMWLASVANAAKR